MEFEDGRNALFCDPNAYIQRFEKKDKNKPKKIIFQEPYESLPNFYINNNFKKGDCDCIKPKFDCEHGCGYKNSYTNHNHNCNHENKNTNNQRCTNCDSNHNNSNNQKSFGFDLKNLLPLLGMFNKGGGADLSSLVSLLNSKNNSQNGDNSNPMGLISSILSNPNALSGILNMFKGGGVNLFNKKQTTKKELKTTDFEIKNYTRVE
ncbi:MAG: hypothetical protein IJW36_00575 [Clostridia bacterium]|nr:hypothetical protein [Clostridia bacterium]